VVRYLDVKINCGGRKDPVVGTVDSFKARGALRVGDASYEI